MTMIETHEKLSHKFGKSIFIDGLSDLSHQIKLVEYIMNREKMSSSYAIRTQKNKRGNPFLCKPGGRLMTL